MEKQRRPLDVGEASSGLEELPGDVDLLAGGRGHFSEFTAEFVRVIRCDTVEIDEVAVDVVDDLQLGFWLREEEGAASGECLDVTGSLGYVGQEVFQMAAFATGPRNDGKRSHAPRNRDRAEIVNFSFCPGNLGV
jgi:hypothetical protein